MSISKLIVDEAQRALHDLYGLVPVADRNYADDHMRSLEQAIYALDQMIGKIQQAESLVYHASRELDLAYRNATEVVQ